MNIRGEGTSSFSFFIALEQVHAWDNAGNAFSISQVAYASIVAGSTGRNRRPGILVSSSKHVWLGDMWIQRSGGENGCGVIRRGYTGYPHKRGQI